MSPPLLLALLALLLAGCSEGRSVVGLAPDAGSDPQDAPDDLSLPAFDVPSFDVPTARDLPAEAPDVDPTCALDRDCPRGQRCLHARCAEDVCLASENACGGDRCEMRCVPVRDLC